MGEKHIVQHHNMFGPSCETASGNCGEDFKIYCRKEHKICIPKQCDQCAYFGHDEMGFGVCCVWEESYEEVRSEDHVVSHDEVYLEFQRAENPEVYKRMVQMLADGEMDLSKLWQNID